MLASKTCALGATIDTAEKEKNGFPDVGEYASYEIVSCLLTESACVDNNSRGTHAHTSAIWPSFLTRPEKRLRDPFRKQEKLPLSCLRGSSLKLGICG